MTDSPPTPPSVLEKAFAIARERLRYVYVGNIFIDGTEDTRCHACGETVVRRVGYDVTVLGAGGRCPRCGTQVKGVWS